MWLVAAFALLFVALVVFDLIERPKRERAAKEAREKREQEVARRGWKLDIETGKQHTRYVYSGTTGGVAWRCEMSSWRSIPRFGRSSQEKVFTRWWTEEAVVRQGVLAVWPRFGEGQQINMQVPQFALNLILGPLVKALGGDASDAELLTSATPVPANDATVDAHYLLRATDPRLMHHFLEAGGRAALADAASWLPDRADEHHLVLATAGHRGLAILLRGWVDDPGEIERVAAVGARLTRTTVAAAELFACNART